MLKKIDDAIYAAERILTLGLIACMALAVFLDVTHRKFNEPVGNIERVLTHFLPMEQATIHTWLVPVVLMLLTFGLCYAGFRTAETTPPIPRNKALGYSVATALGLVVFVKGLLFLLPNGLIFSQKMALCMLLWVGFIGASMATREGNHIVFEVADRIWPARIRPYVKHVAAGSAVVFCLGLSALAISYTSHHYRDWADSQHVAGVFEGFPAPIWMVYGFLPVPLAIMAFRFARLGVLSTEIDVPKVEGQEPT